MCIRDRYCNVINRCLNKIWSVEEPISALHSDEVLQNSMGHCRHKNSDTISVLQGSVSEMYGECLIWHFANTFFSRMNKKNALNFTEIPPPPVNKLKCLFQKLFDWITFYNKLLKTYCSDKINTKYYTCNALN